MVKKESKSLRLNPEEEEILKWQELVRIVEKKNKALGKEYQDELNSRVDLTLNDPMTGEPKEPPEEF